MRQLAKGGLDMIALRGRDGFVYESAMARLQPLGVSLDDAAARWPGSFGIGPASATPLNWSADAARPR